MNHLQIYDNALPKESCRNIIKYFDNHPDIGDVSFNGMYDTKGRRKKEIKNGTSLTFEFNSLPDCMNMLIPTLSIGIEKYKKKFTELNELRNWNLTRDFNVQRFIGKEEGYFARHCEADGYGGTNSRMLVWMIYLNNAKCGTRFYDPRRDIRAKEGRLVIWPAFWTHPHSGITPNIGRKYLMTGWWCFY